MTQPPLTKRVQCKNCLATAEIPAADDPHEHTWCQCCTQDHHHGQGVLEAGECAAANHPGEPCWSPPGQPGRPGGCTVCRPVIHFAVAGDLRTVA